VQSGWYDRRTRKARDLSCGDRRVYPEFELRRIHCRHCGTVKRERLEFLVDNPFYTKRFAYYVGRRCRSATIKDIAEELRLDWDTVKTLEKQRMAAQLAKAGTPGPKVIGIDELSIRKGQKYTLLSHRENPTMERRRSLNTFLPPKKRLNGLLTQLRPRCRR
jgi:transposase